MFLTTHKGKLVVIQPVDVHLTEHKKQVRLPPYCLYPAKDFLRNSDFPPLHSDCC